MSYFTLARDRCSPAHPHADRRGAFCSLGAFCLWAPSQGWDWEVVADPQGREHQGRI